MNISMTSESLMVFPFEKGVITIYIGKPEILIGNPLIRANPFGKLQEIIIMDSDLWQLMQFLHSF